MSALFNAAVLVAVFGFGAPPWILIPVNIAGMTLYTEMDSRIRPR